MADVALFVGLAILGAAAGFVLGRFTGTGANQIRDLRARNELLAKEKEHALAEREAAIAAMKRAVRVQEEYRANVTQHFSGTSELLRELTHKYRDVYDHLANGAGELCPEGFLGLAESLHSEELTAGDTAESGDAESASQDSDEAREGS